MTPDHKLVPFNVNNYVRVKLTERGLAVLEADYESYAMPSSGPFVPPEVDADGFARFQLWELMSVFGNGIGMGVATPFETIIRVELSAPPPPAEVAGGEIVGWCVESVRSNHGTIRSFHENESDARILEESLNRAFVRPCEVWPVRKSSASRPSPVGVVDEGLVSRFLFAWYGPEWPKYEADIRDEAETRELTRTALTAALTPAAPVAESVPKLEVCPDGCWRPKARNAEDAAAGCCSKWWAIRDQGAADECAKLATFWKAVNEPSPPVAAGLTVEEEALIRARRDAEAVAKDSMDRRYYQHCLGWVDDSHAYANPECVEHLSHYLTKAEADAERVRRLSASPVSGGKV